jgi:hypothetical protein
MITWVTKNIDCLILRIHHFDHSSNSDRIKKRYNASVINSRKRGPCLSNELLSAFRNKYFHPAIMAFVVSDYFLYLNTSLVNYVMVDSFLT